MQPILITGGTGTLGRAFARLCTERGLAHVVTTRDALDITSGDQVARALDRHQPWLVINTAGYVRVDDAESDPLRCHRENVVGPRTLALACARAHVQLLSFSTDLVFDGRKEELYEEHDAPAPLGVYGRTKHEAEQCVLDAHAAALVVRTSAFFGPWDEHNFVTHTLRALASGQPVFATSDEIVSPTYVPDLVHACLDLAIDGENGLWHLANRGATSWLELARSAAQITGHDPDRITPMRSSSLSARAKRPKFSALGSARGLLLPRLEDALDRYHRASGSMA